MNHRTLFLLLTATLLSASLRAQTPPLINYQGRIAVGSTNFDGPGEFKFALVDAGVNQNTQARALAIVNLITARWSPSL